MFSKVVLNLFTNPINAGRIMKPDGIASLSNMEGTANVEFSLRIIDDVIKDCNFRAQANPYIIAICSTITQMVIGKNIDDVMLEPTSVKKQLGDVQDVEIGFCIECMDLAIEDYVETREKEGKPKSTRGRKKKVVEPILDEKTAKAISEAIEPLVVSKLPPDADFDSAFGVEPESNETAGQSTDFDARQGSVEDEQKTNQNNQTQPHVTKAFEGSIFNNPIFVNFFNNIPKGE